MVTTIDRNNDFRRDYIVPSWNAIFRQPLLEFSSTHCKTISSKLKIRTDFRSSHNLENCFASMCNEIFYTVVYRLTIGNVL